MKSNFFSKTLLSNGIGRGITSSTLQSAIVLVIVFSFLGCYPTRYASYHPAGSAMGWPVKADWPLGQGVVIRINDEVVIRGAMPWLGTKEYRTEYRGHEVRLVTSYTDTAILYIDGDLVGQFSW